MVTVVTIIPTAALASPITLDFESGDLSNWTITIPTGNAGPYLNIPLGTATTANAQTIGGSVGDFVSPVDGSYFAAIGNASFPVDHPLPSTPIAIQQTLWLTSGTTLSGWAALQNGDYLETDHAFVRVFDAGAVELATPWSATSGGWDLSPGSAPRPLVIWNAWQWQAPSDGEYTLQLGINVDSDRSSYSLHDGIRTHEPTSVPEPASLLLIGTGLAAMGFRRISGSRRP